MKPGPYSMHSMPNPLKWQVSARTWNAMTGAHDRFGASNRGVIADKALRQG